MTSLNAFTRRLDRSRRSALTLVEVMISVALTGLIISMALGSIIFLTKAAVSIGFYSEMNNQCKICLAMFSRDMRSVSEVVSSSPTDLIVTSTTSTGTTQIEYKFDTNKKELVRTYMAPDGTTTETKTYLTGVNDFKFTYYNLINEETTKNNEIKKVQINAKLMRTRLSIENEDYVVSARITLRNRQIAI